MAKWYVRAAVVVLSLVSIIGTGWAQDSCPGELDGNGQITEGDIVTFVQILFGDAAQQPQADANNDDAVTVADYPAIVADLGAVERGVEARGLDRGLYAIGELLADDLLEIRLDARIDVGEQFFLEFFKLHKRIKITDKMPR